MKMRFVNLMVSATILTTNPVFAMEDTALSRASTSLAENTKETIDLRAITPIKNGMNSLQWMKATQLFLKEVLIPENRLEMTQVLSKRRHQCGGRSFYIFTFTDGSEWVKGEGGLNRFLGYHYLKKALDHYELKNIRVAETRFAYNPQPNDMSRVFNDELLVSVKPVMGRPLIDSPDFFAFSRYMGDGSINVGEAEDKIEILREKIGFRDTLFGQNFRKKTEEKEGKKEEYIYIIDTEYKSFGSRNIPPYVIEDLKQEGEEYLMSKDLMRAKIYKECKGDDFYLQ